MTLTEYQQRHPEIPRLVTLAYLLREDEILLAHKKMGFGEGNIKGIGGKVEKGESIKECLIREVQEEVDVTVTDYEKVAVLDAFFLHKEKWNQRIHAFIVTKWEGEPSETDEMRPCWFKQSAIPYDRMWEDNQYWLPRVLQGEKLEGAFLFADESTMKDHQLTPVKQFSDV